MQKTFNHTLGSIFIDEHSFVRMNFVENAELSMENVSEFLKLWEEVCSGDKKPFLIDLRGSFISIPLNFIKLLSSNSHSTKWKIAEAIIIDSLSQRLMLRFYKPTEPPQFPFKIFTSENDAITWLKQHQTSLIK